MQFSKKNIIIDSLFSSKEELFKHISELAFKDKIITSKEKVVNSFIKREKEGTTGFEDYVAIPHARTLEITKPAIYIIRNKKNINNWDSLDGKGVKIAIALLIPEGQGNIHMEVLSKVAKKLLDENFRKIIKTSNQNEILKEFQDLLNKNNQDERKNIYENNKGNKLIVGISACPSGIAHTFMAEKKMIDSAKKLGHRIHWETQGNNGQKNKIPSKLIDEADAIIIASDIDINLDRFENKNIYQTTTNDAIKNSSQLITKVLKGKKSEKSNFGKFMGMIQKSFNHNFGKAFTYLSITAVILSFISLIGFSMYGQRWNGEAFILNENLAKIQEISKIFLHFSMPLMAGFVAKKSTGKDEAFALALIGSVLLNIPQFATTFNSISANSISLSYKESIYYDWNGIIGINNIVQGSNILSSVLLTFIVISLIKGATKFKNIIDSNKKIKFLKHGMSPWVTIVMPTIIVTLFIFVFGLPLSYASGKMNTFFTTTLDNKIWLKFIVGGILGMFIVLDLGGGINKITLVLLVGLAQNDLRYASLIPVGIPVASLGYGLTYKFFKNKFKNEDLQSASESFSKGLKGMTEGPLLATNKYGWRVYIPNLISNFVACGLTLVLGIYVYKAGHIGVFWLGAQAHLGSFTGIGFIDYLLPRGAGIVTAIASLIYGIFAYIFVITLGMVLYLIIARITFNIPGKNKVFKKKELIKNE